LPADYDRWSGGEKLDLSLTATEQSGRAALGPDGLAVPGRVVDPGDVLASITAPAPVDALDPQERLLQAIFGEKATPTRDMSLRLDGNRPGRVIAELVQHNPRFPGDAIDRMPGRSFGSGMRSRPQRHSAHHRDRGG
jgi:DNA-directed RNA polymerase beta subunit